MTAASEHHMMNSIMISWLSHKKDQHHDSIIQAKHLLLLYHMMAVTITADRVTKHNVIIMTDDNIMKCVMAAV